MVSVSLVVSASSTPPLTQNAKTVQANGRLISFGTKDSFSNATVVTYDPHGNFYVGGITEGTLPGAKGEGNLFIRAYTPNGQDVWTRQFQGADEGSAEIRALTASTEHLYAVGMGSDCLDAQCITSQHAGFLLQYDLSGQMIWKRKIAVSDPTTERLENISVAVVPGENDIYVAMETSRPDIGDIHSSRKIKILRFDRSGEALWSKEFPIGSAGHLNSIDADSNGNLIVFGSTSAALSGAPKVGSTDLFIRVYNAKGKEMWTRQFGSKGGISRIRVASIDGQGNMYLLGETSSGGSLDGGSKPVEFIQKYKANGQEQWAVKANSKDIHFLSTFATDPAGNVYVSANNNETRLFIQVYDSNGQKIKQEPLNPENPVTSIAVDHKGNLAAVGAIFRSDKENGTPPVMGPFVYLVRPLQ